MADELISRKAAIKLLREECVAKYPYSFCSGLLVAADEVRKLPALDAVEVVRCGTPCRWLYDEPDNYCCMNHKGLVSITPDSFCSYGRRAEEDG